MSVCPFCKATVANAHRPCPECGRLASDHPSISAVAGRTLSTDFDDDDHGELDLEQGSSVGHGGAAAAPYEGGGLTLDDDFLDDAPPPGGLELDVPKGHSSERRLLAPYPAPPPPPPSSERLPRASGSQPTAGQSGRHPAAIAHDAPAPPPSSSGSLPVRSSSPEIAPPSDPGPPPPPPPPDPAAIVARYPPPPTKVWQSPHYALRVLWRQFELRQDLVSLRRRRSPDVPLYERALKVHDGKSFTVGLAITCAGLVIATFVFFLPVILRFLRAPN